MFPVAGVLRVVAEFFNSRHWSTRDTRLGQMSRGGDNEPEESPLAFSMPESLSEYMRRYVAPCFRSVVENFVDIWLQLRTFGGCEQKGFMVK